MSGFNDKAKTEVEIMWTNQHGTGKKADHFVESQVILQYMCQEFPDGDVPLANINTQFEYHTIRNGGTSSTQTFRANQKESSDVKLTLGLHEPYNYYQSYLRRERNKGRTFYIRLEGTQQSLTPYPFTCIYAFDRRVACSRLSDSGGRRERKRRAKSWRGGKKEKAAPSLPSFLPFYFRVCAFSMQRTRLSRSLEQANRKGPPYRLLENGSPFPYLAGLSISTDNRRNASATLLRAVGYFSTRKETISFKNIVNKNKSVNLN